MLKSHVLTILAGGPAKGMIVSVLKQECGIRTRERIGEVEWAAAVTRLKTDGLIEDGEPDTLTDDATLKLTDRGREMSARM